MKNLEDCHDINVQSDTLFLAHIFEKKIDLHPAYFYLAPGLAQIAALKETEIEL